MSECDIQKLISDHTALQNENTILKEQLALMQEQLEWFRKQFFGRKTEQTSVIMNEGTQLSMFPEENVQAVSSFSETINVPAHQRKKKRTHDDWMSELPVEEVLHKEDDPKCDNCGSDMTEIGEDKYDELIYTPAKFHIRRHTVKVYKCIKCGTAPEVSTEPCNIRRAEHPELMIREAIVLLNSLHILFMRSFVKLCLYIGRRRTSNLKVSHC